MFRNLFANLFTRRVIIGVDMELRGDSKQISSCNLQLKGAILSVLSTCPELKSVAHFAKQYQGGAIALNIRGKGVLVRKLEKFEILDQKTLHSILPNANLDDFYTQIVQTDLGTTLSLIRKSDADDLINQFAGNGYSVVELRLDNYTENAAYQVGVAFFVDELATELKVPQVDDARSKVTAKAKLSRISILTVPALMVLLLINFFAYNHYSLRLANCRIKSNLSAAQVGKLRATENQLLERTSIIKGVGWTSGLRYGYLIDRLLAQMPAQITVEAFAINPIDRKQTQGSKILTYQTATTISGNCAIASELNNWLYSMKLVPQVVNCTINSYVVNQNTGRGEFLITIYLDDVSI